MPEKNIEIDEEAYQILKSRKKQGETVSDVIKRMSKQKTMKEIVNVLSEKEGKRLTKKLETQKKLE